MHGEREDVCSLTPLRGLGDVFPLSLDETFAKPPSFPRTPGHSRAHSMSFPRRRESRGAG